MPTLPSRSDRLVLAAIPLIPIATVLSATQGGVPGVVVLALTVAGSFALARRVASPGELQFVIAVALGTLVLRDIAAGLLDAHLAERNPYRALFYDDGAYVLYARQISEFLTGGDIGFPTDPSVQNSYAIGIGIIFSFIGENVMVVRLINSFSLTVAGLLTYRTMQNLGLPGARWGLLGMVLFPSLTLWSVLALKDTYVLVWLVAAVWGASEFARSGRYVWFTPTVAALLVLDGARHFVFLLLALAWPLGLAIGLSGRRRILASALAVICTVLLVLRSPAFGVLTLDTVGALSWVRAAMAQGARTAFVEPLPAIRGKEGDRFLVTVADDMPECTIPGREVEVQLGNSVIVRVTGTPPPPEGATIFVAPCDVIVLVPPAVAASTPRPTGVPTPGATPEPTLRPSPEPTLRPNPQPVALVPEARNVVAEVAPTSPEPAGFRLGVIESVLYLPIGFLFFLTAPIPLSVASIGEIAAIPEMLLWYAAVVLATYGGYKLLRAGDLRYAFGALALGGIALVLSLAEGNAGTLIRHRAMAIAFVVVFAAVGLEALLVRRARQRTR